MSRAKRSTGARSLGHIRAAVLIVGASALLLAAAWTSWRWQHTSTARCGREPSESTPAGAKAHTEWERCRAGKQADGAVPAALAVFAVMVTASGVAMAFAFRSGTRWVQSEVR
jgi:hypothetical protein